MRETPEGRSAAAAARRTAALLSRRALLLEEKKRKEKQSRTLSGDELARAKPSVDLEAALATRGSVASAATAASEAKRSNGKGAGGRGECCASSSAEDAWTAAANGFFRIALAPPRQAVGWMRGCGGAGVGR